MALALTTPSVLALPQVEEKGLRSYYISKLEELQIKIRDKTNNLERLDCDVHIAYIHAHIMNTHSLINT